VADLVRGKSVKEALPVLNVLAKRAAGPMRKLVLSAVANAVHNDKANKDELFIVEIRVDESPTLKRSRPRARGRAFPIKKRTSRVFVRLEEKVIVVEDADVAVKKVAKIAGRKKKTEDK
jgi:large subunit ribosomal protein L22